ncbi:ATP-dependent DNA helicase Snf21, partial [Coemansia sp. RSA 522]
AVEASVDPEYGRRHCDLFLDLPSKRDYPDYYVIIRQPIAMKTIRRNVKAHRYANVTDFHRDWKLMFDNARTYNEEGSMVYDDACVLQRALEATLSEKTGENFTTPMGTQSPLPAAFSAALQQSAASGTSVAPISPGATFASNGVASPTAPVPADMHVRPPGFGGTPNGTSGH